MLDEFVLISYHKDYRSGRYIWLVYGHVAPGVNKSIGEFIKQEDAIDKALEFDLPIVRGRNYDRILDALNAFRSPFSPETSICGQDLHSLLDEKGFIFCGYCGGNLSVK
jgi:hypothetical protein